MGFRMAKIFLTLGDFQRLKIKVKISLRQSQISLKRYDRYGGKMSIDMESSTGHGQPMKTLKSKTERDREKVSIEVR